jgi:hypothetical protein
MKRRASVKRRTRRRTQQKRARRHTLRKRQRGGESPDRPPVGSIVIQRDAGDKYSPFLAVERDTARAELSEASQ